MNYIVLDLEWNQSTPQVNDEIKSLPFEIIEIGAVKLNENFEMIDRFEQIIKPIVYPELHYICKELTGFSEEELQNGIPFVEAFQKFSNWCGKDFIFCTWGASDVSELQRNMQYYEIMLFPVPVFFYNIQELFRILIERCEHTRSLEYAVNYLEIEKTIHFHHADNDAWYTALVMQHFDKAAMLQYSSIDTYQKPLTSKDEIYVVYEHCSKYISRVFPSKTAAMADNHVSSSKCYKCGRKLRKKLRWFSENAKNYYCLCECPDHGMLSGTIRMKKAENDSYFVVKTMELISREQAQAIIQKKNEITKKKRLKRKQT